MGSLNTVRGLDTSVVLVIALIFISFWCMQGAFQSGELFEEIYKITGQV